LSGLGYELLGQFCDLGRLGRSSGHGVDWS
jgi:hypothetical protein